MHTKIFSNLSNLAEAAHILQNGGLVATPTETVYGLAADAMNPEAVANIFKAKGRPSDNPLIVHIADLSVLQELVIDIPDYAYKLIDAFWPGPLTLIFKASDKIPPIVRAGLPTVAIRFPSHLVIQNLITCSGLSLAAPSANTSGKPSPTNAKRVIEDLEGKVEAIIDGGDCSVGLESTVLDITGDIPTILRPGGITFDRLKEVLGNVLIDPALTQLDGNIKPKAPGMKYTHYSPNATVTIVKGPLNKVVDEISRRVQEQKKSGKRVGVLATEETKSLFNCDIVLSVGSSGHLETVANHLFETLRQFDDLKVDIVYSLAFPEEGIGKAIMNRLEKSAGYNIIYK